MTHARRTQRIIITGASSGIGAALARHYGASGATLGLIARRQALLEQLSTSLSTPCEIYSADVRDARAISGVACHFTQKHGSPDIVVANAGISIGTLTDFAADAEAFRDVIDTNVIGMVNSFQPFLEGMRETGRGALVGIASVAGYRGLAGATAYSASKAAAISYLEGLRVELRASGIRVITICPGFVDTPMTKQNPYPMPFRMDADTAAGKIAAVIARGRTYAVIPWQMAIVARVLRVIPNWMYDRLLGGVPYKPRRGD